MATDNPTPPEGFNKVEPSADNDEDVETIELDAGEVLEGVVLNIQDGEHDDHGPWHRLRIKDLSRGVVQYFAKGDAKQAVATGYLEAGDSVWICCETEEQSFENADGETVTYNPTRCFVED